MGIKALVQAGIVDFSRILRDRVRALVLEAILSIMAQKVIELCGESRCSGARNDRRAGTVKATIQTASSKVLSTKLRVRTIPDNGKKREETARCGDKTSV